jgi:hypothetical protein
VSTRTKELIGAAALAISGILMIATAVWLSVPCKPGDRGLYIGGSMLIAGCPEKNR